MLYSFVEIRKPWLQVIQQNVIQPNVRARRDKTKQSTHVLACPPATIECNVQSRPVPLDSCFARLPTVLDISIVCQSRYGLKQRKEPCATYKRRRFCPAESLAKKLRLVIAFDMPKKNFCQLEKVLSMWFFSVLLALAALWFGICFVLFNFNSCECDAHTYKEEWHWLDKCQPDGSIKRVREVLQIIRAPTYDLQAGSLICNICDLPIA
jgi:hypothetical protein